MPLLPQQAPHDVSTREKTELADANDSLSSPALAAVIPSCPIGPLRAIQAGLHSTVAGVPPAGPSPFLSPGIEHAGPAAVPFALKWHASRKYETGEPETAADASLAAGLAAPRSMMHVGMRRVAGPAQVA